MKWTQRMAIFTVIVVIAAVTFLPAAVTSGATADYTDRLQDKDILNNFFYSLFVPEFVPANAEKI